MITTKERLEARRHEAIAKRHDDIADMIEATRDWPDVKPRVRLLDKLLVAAGVIALVVTILAILAARS